MIEGVRCYSKSLITYIVKEILGYDIVGNYSSWVANSNYYCSISMEEDKGIILLTIGRNEISFVTVANDTQENAKNIKTKWQYILSLGNSGKDGRIINISPYDVDSVERVGRIIKEFIFRHHLENINAKFEYPQILKDYVKYIGTQSVIFDANYTYSFKGIPQMEISDKDVVARLEEDELFNRRSRPDRDTIRLNMISLVVDINKNAEKILSILLCQNKDCHMNVQRQDAKQLEYLQCPCGFVLDSKDGHVVFKNKDPRYETLSPSDWGMDYVKFII